MRPVHREVAKYEQREADSMEQPSAGDASFSPTRRVGARGGPQLFAQKLFTLVEEEDPDIVEWLPDGLAFRVKDIQRFSNEVLEKYFNHSKFTSFQRQLNLYQFKRRKGAHAGAFHHPCFRRGQRHLLSKVRRQKVKRDLAVEARAAQRIVRTGEASHVQRLSNYSSRGKTRAATQADIRPIKPDGDNTVSDGEYEVGSRRSALRRRVDAGPSMRGVNGGCTDDENAQRDHDRSTNAVGIGHVGDWKQQVPGSPQSSFRQLINPSTPITAQSSDYSASSPGSTTSDASSLSSTPQYSTVLQCNSGQLDDKTCNSSQDSPLSIHSPVATVAAAVQAAQTSPGNPGFSLAAAVNASTSWPNPSQSVAQRLFEPFTWNESGPDSEAPWTEPPTATASQPHNEDFGFIDLFSENLEPNEEPPTETSMDDSRIEAFMKEAEAAGVFGVEEYFLPRGGYGSAAIA